MEVVRNTMILFKLRPWHGVCLIQRVHSRIEDITMRKYLVLCAGLVLTAGLGLVSFAAHAMPVSVDLSSCGGLTSCPSDGVTFTGWQYDTTSSTWVNTALTYKGDPNNETGLGVACTGGKCNENEIDDTPPQLVAADLGGISFSSLSLGVGSVDCNGSTNCDDPEIAYIYGAMCAQPGTCAATELGSYAGSDYPGNAHIFTFTAAELMGNDFLWVTPVSPTDLGSVNDANFLLASLTYTTAVPEPAALGMFGLGVLLIGLFAGLRRRID